MYAIRSYYDENGVLISASEDGGDPVAIGFRAKKANGKYRYFWLYRVKFGVPSTNLATKGDSITFSTPSIEGTVSRRNKPDGNDRHPWKAEVNEDDTDVLPRITSYNVCYTKLLRVRIQMEPINAVMPEIFSPLWI